MKVSRFNIVEEMEDGILIYNTNSNGILKLNKDYTRKYKDLLKNEGEIDKAFEEALLYGKMIIRDQDGDELDKIFIENKLRRFGSDRIDLTIAPTMACNFRCPYCYEKGKEYTSMNEDTVQKVKEYIEKLKENYKYIGITWYGGEPLLALSTITELMESVYDNFDKDYVYSNIVSNGYLLTEDTANELKKYNISDIQITIDGPPEIHNKRRMLPSKEDTFFAIFDNMKSALNVYPDLHISIRVNIDKTNINGVDEIISYLKQYGLYKKVSLYLAPVSNINETSNESNCFNVKEFAVEELNFIKRNHAKGYSFIGLPSRNIGICGAVSIHSYVIDPLGDMYKCWNDISCLSEKIGSVYDKEINLNGNMTKWLSYSIENDEECVKCPYLPVCMGGCPSYRIRSMNKKCHVIKENAKQIVHLIYDITQQRKEKNV